MINCNGKCFFLVGFLADHVPFMWPRNLDLSISLMHWSALSIISITKYSQTH